MAAGDTTVGSTPSTTQSHPGGNRPLPLSGPPARPKGRHQDRAKREHRAASRRSSGRSVTTASTASPDRSPTSSTRSSSIAGLRKPPGPSPGSSGSAASSDICRELGHQRRARYVNRSRNALYQNASAFITAKIRYRQSGRHGANAGSGFHPLQRRLHRRGAARRPQGRCGLYHPQRYLHAGHQRGDDPSARLRLPQGPAPGLATVL